MGAEGRVLYRARKLRDSLFWLAWSLLFGATPLAVHVSSPARPLSSLLMALILGVPSFAYSLLLLGESQALLLDSTRQQLCVISDTFHRRRIEECDLSQVEAVKVIYDPNSSSEFGNPALSIALGGGRELLLPVSSWDQAQRLQVKLSSEVGL